MQQVVSPKYKKYLIEDCFKLSIGDMGRSILSRQNYKKNTTFRLASAQGIIELFYRLQRNDNYPSVHMWFADINKRKYSTELTHKQIITITITKATFGSRPHFTCPLCLRRCNKLYRRPGYEYFACRMPLCLNLMYESTTINRKKLGGELFYANSRIYKLFSKAERLGRLYYNGKLTKKVLAYLKIKAKWMSPEIKQKIELQMPKLKSHSI